MGIISPGQTKPKAAAYVAVFRCPSGKHASVEVEAQTWGLAAKKAFIMLPSVGLCGELVPSGSKLVAMAMRRGVVGVCTRCEIVLFTDDRPQSRDGRWFCAECR